MYFIYFVYASRSLKTCQKEENVLKETQKNSKIELDIFVSIEQIISKRITYKVGE